MGHAINKVCFACVIRRETNLDLVIFCWISQVLKDIIIRQQIINGNKVHYRPGWDCHGLPIESKAKNIKKDMTPALIRKRCKFSSSPFSDFLLAF